MTLRIPAGTLLACVLAGCHTATDPFGDDHLVAVPATFSAGAEVSPDTLDDSPWWSAFGSAELDGLMERALSDSYELAAAYARLGASRAQARAAGSPLWPSVDLNASVSDFRIDQRGGGGAQIPLRFGEVYNLGPSLSYELDLFGRIRASRDSAELAAEASREDARALALTLSGQVMESWLDAAENRALRALVEEQIRTGEDLLEVTRTRFSNGAGSGLAVLQQERQLEGTRAELPVIDGALERARYQLAVLLGEAPGAGVLTGAGARIPALPPLEGLDVPAALLERRPDIAAAAYRVRSLDEGVAAAISARYPRLSVSASYNFDGSKVADIFDRTIQNLAANLAAPIIDGGQRRADVARAKAQLAEALANLNQTFLTAVREVEDALSLERRGVERRDALARQADLARREVEQARRRYAGGVDTYLQVLTALQTSQAVERQLVTQSVAVLRARASLLRALGGALADHNASETDEG